MTKALIGKIMAEWLTASRLTPHSEEGLWLRESLNEVAETARKELLEEWRKEYEDEQEKLLKGFAYKPKQV